MKVYLFAIKRNPRKKICKSSMNIMASKKSGVMLVAMAYHIGAI